MSSIRPRASSHLLLLAVLGLALAGPGCGGESPVMLVDAGVPLDTGPRLDAGPRLDTGPQPDTWPQPDADRDTGPTPVDGGGSCGDGICAATETAASCAADCATAGFCGDDTCTPPEDPTTCARDCPGTCGFTCA
jgi:hypothetical protein